MNIGKDAVNSVIGNTESAVIQIHDYRSKAAEGTEASLSALSEVLKKGKRPEDLLDRKGEDLKRFFVQFNPKELGIYAKSEQIKKKSNEQRPGQALAECTYELEPASVSLSVNLIFDHVVNQDAFLLDRIPLSLSKAAGDMKKLSGKVYSVQPEVEGIIAALRNPFTRLVTFQWGDFSFMGALEDVRAEYTMFSPSGRPIRANVTIQIAQDDASDTIKQWKNYYTEVF